MKHINKIAYLLSLALIVLHSCTDESKFTNPVTFHLDNGAFAIFDEGAAPAVVAFDNPSTSGFTRTLVDPAGNITDYTLEFTATLTNGQTLLVEDYFTTNTFPTTINITAQSLADALDFDLADLDFGDNFRFVGTTTRSDGTVFIGLPPNQNDDGSIAQGNTEPQLFLDSYRNAMNFGFTFACPEYTTTDVEGIYSVASHTYVEGFGLTGDDPITVTSVSDTKIELSPILSFHNGPAIIITVDVTTGLASYTENPADIMFDDFGLDGTITNISGLVLPCADTISLTIQTQCCVDNIINLARN